VHNVPSSTFPPAIVAGGGLDTRAAHLPLSEVQQVARSRYGITGDFKRFATEKDDSYRIRAVDGRAIVLKIANPAELTIEVDLQLELLRHVERIDPTLPVPRVVLDVNGSMRSEYAAADGTMRIVRAMSYLVGTPLDMIDGETGAQRELLGEHVARLRLATADFSHPGDGRKLAWDIQHLAEIAPLLSEVKDKEQRTLVEAALERFVAVAGDCRDLRRQVLHNDVNRSNTLVDCQKPQFVTGMIDFGDAVRTAIAIDLSTTLAGNLPAEPTEDAFASGRDIVRGYLRFADLTDRELALAPHLAMGRVIARTLLTTFRARIFPENAQYITRIRDHGWWQLRWFLDRSVEEISGSLTS
jgi:Ser/Thr protein kinase RdoA (MazF antagonist)